MASSYFDEHDVSSGETPDQMVLMARLLIDTGMWNQSDFSALFSDRPPPPTSRKFIEEELKTKVVREEEDEFDCPVCLKKCEQDEESSALPCAHRFHKGCIVPWLKKTSSCPLCRFELPTDDAGYEEMKRQRKRQKQREDDVKNLHDSMFG